MSRSLNIFKVCSLALIFFVTGVYCLFAQELSAKEIIKHQDDLMRGDTLWGKYTMQVITPNWQRTLELDVWSEGRDKTFIRILSPAKEAGVGTLRIKESMWNYLPKVERTIKIPPSMMLQAWMGSDFCNDDLVKESSLVNDYTHNTLGEEETSFGAAYKIELIPKPEAAVTWGKLTFLVRKDGFVPLLEEYYNEHGKLIKVLEYSQIKQMSGRVIPTLWKMTAVTKEGHQTIIEVKEAEYNLPIDEDIFTLANLKRAE